jgi:CheY-like chemotaxis protein
VNIFVLEDDEQRKLAFKRKFLGHNITIIDNIKEAINILSTNIAFDMIFLDHDLGGEVYVNSENENTGYQLAKWISQQKKILKESIIIVHSLNQVGAQNIKAVLPNAWLQPFAWKE